MYTPVLAGVEGWLIYTGMQPLALLFHTKLAALTKPRVIVAQALFIAKLCYVLLSLEAT